jgi:hypothetical protein
MFLFRWFALSCVVLLAGCATETFAPENAPEYMAIKDYVPFYRLGPAQATGPDSVLRVSTRFKLLRRELGYSFVLLDDQRTGYVASEWIVPAPPRPPTRLTLTEEDAAAPASRRPRGTSRRPDSPRYRGEQVNDTPLPDPSVPPPDLNIGPEEVPEPAATPTEPAEKPKFRF